jgi:hypothetical protein
MSEAIEPAKKQSSNRSKAFRETFNTVPLGALLVLSLATLSPLPLVAGTLLAVGAILEGAYLAAVPNSKWYLNRLATKYDSEILKRREELKRKIYPQLREVMRVKFDRLETARAGMEDPKQQDNPRFREVLRKVDYLLEKFLLFGTKEQEFRTYLRSVLSECLLDSGVRPPARVTSKRSDDEPLPGEPPVDPTDVWAQAVVDKIQRFFDEELQKLESASKDPDDLSTNAVLEKRTDVIHRRRDYVGQIGKILMNLNNQVELMEDTLGLINDELRARSPEQVLADIDDVVYKADALMEMLDEVAPNNPMPAQFAPTSDEQQLRA